ncbi:MAG TPA: hypothetical protein VFD27_07520, partial [Chthoniobacteraceae bacterium]|nr:hypothetical protein [Chthoniobacteraceae bacterium]
RFFVARYNGNGLLDPSFGSAGKVITPFVSNAEVNALAIQGDGKILAAGSTVVNSADDFALARYDGDGSLDMSFGTGGKVITPVTSSYDWANAVAIQTGTPTTPDKIVAAGTAFNGSTYDAALVRYNLDGSLDTTFGTGGQVLTPVGPEEDVATALLVTGSGLQLRKIMVAGYSATTTDFVPPHQFSLLRYNADGSLDTSFNGTGKVTTPIGGDAFATTLTISNGKFFAAGYTHPIGNLSAFDFALARYNTDGSLDSSFDLDGKKTDDIGSASPVAVLATAIQSDGRIVLAGGGNLAPNSPGFVLARLNANGTLDTSFNGTGKVTTQLDSGAAASGLVIQSDGKLLVTGTTYNGSTYNIALARYNSDGSLDGSFGSGGKVITTLGVVASPRAVAIQPGTFGEPDRIVVAIDFPGASSTRRFALMRYRLDGSIDPTFGFAGLVTNQTFEEASTANPQSFVYSLVIQYSGPSVRKIIVAGSARSSPSAETPAFALARYDPNGSLDSSFGIGGKVITPIRERSGAFSVVLQAGKIVAAGYSGLASSDDDFAVVRYNDDGSFDPSFGSGGSITTPIAVGLDDTARALAIQSNGRIVLAGYSGSGQYGGDDFAVVRYNSDGSLDGSYGIGGKVLLDVDGSEDRTFALALDAAGRAVVAGTSRQLFGVARLLGEVRLEIFSITRDLDGHTVLDGLGVPGAINHIEASPDLSLGSFTNIGTVVPDANALFEFEDPDAPLFSRRFYRLSFP